MDFKMFDISVIPLIVFVTKVIVGVGIPKKFTPLISLILGIGLGVAFYAGESILKGVIIGVFLASSSVGFYSGTKNVYQEVHRRRVDSMKRKKE